MHFFLPRHLQPELMDAPQLDPAAHRQALAGLARINFLSHAAAPVWRALQPLARSGESTISILDLACGGGDVLTALARRAARHGLALDLHGCDISETALALARTRAAGAGINFFRLDPFTAPLARPYDVIMCSLFLHHLTAGRAQELIALMQRHSKALCIINDLERCRAGLALAAAVPRLVTRSRIVHTDAVRSVRAAFTPAEALALAKAAGVINAQIRRCWPFRWQMMWQPCSQP